MLRATLLSILLFIIGASASASTLRNADADGTKSTVDGKIQSIPDVTGTHMISVGLIQEIPSGTINGSNVTFTLANTPGVAASVILTLDGLTLIQGSGKDYTISGATITMATAPATAQNIYASYSKY